MIDLYCFIVVRNKGESILFSSSSCFLRFFSFVFSPTFHDADVCFVLLLKMSYELLDWYMFFLLFLNSEGIIIISFDESYMLWTKRIAVSNKFTVVKLWRINGNNFVIDALTAGLSSFSAICLKRYSVLIELFWKKIFFISKKILLFIKNG